MEISQQNFLTNWLKKLKQSEEPINANATLAARESGAASAPSLLSELSEAVGTAVYDVTLVAWLW